MDSLNNHDRDRRIERLEREITQKADRHELSKINNIQNETNDIRRTIGYLEESIAEIRSKIEYLESRMPEVSYD